MKKIAVLILLITVAFAVNAQNSKRTSAFNYLRYGKLDKAKEAIDAATEHPKTMNDPKTWFYRGNVYLAIQLSDDEKYKNLDPDPLDEAYNAYLKAKELDEKGEFTKEIDDRLTVCAEQYYNKGVIFYNNKKYDEAMQAFGRAASMNESLGLVDTTSNFSAALCAELAHKNDEAIKYYKKLLAMNYKKPDVYNSLANIAKVQGDTAQALQYIHEGRDIFPNSIELMISETNIYLATGDTEKAMELLKLAIKQDDKNPTLYYAIGTNYDNAGNFEEAEKNYLKAIELDPNYFDANYNLAALYVNKGISIFAEADKLPLNAEEKYNQMIDEAKSYYEKALPYAEKSGEISPNDEYAIRILKEIYTRLKMTDKLKDINERSSN